MTSIDDFLSALSSPLNFLAHAPVDAVVRTTLPSHQFARRAQALALNARDAGVRRDLEALSAELIAYETAAPEQRRATVDRCRALIERLRCGSDAPGATYQCSSGDPAEQLKALSQSAQFVRGVGPRFAEKFRRFGIRSVEDLLYHLPFRYEDRRSLSTIRQLRVGAVASVVGELTHLAERYVGRNQRRILEGVLRDDTGLLALTWYHQVAYFRSRYQVGQRCLVHGKVEGGPTSQKRMVHPEVDLSSDLEGQSILPVYNKPTTTSVGVMRKIVQQAAADWAERLPSVLPQAVAQRARIVDLRQAMQLIHTPPRDADVGALNAYRSLGHRSLVFDELFFLQLGMALRRRSVETESGLALMKRGTLTERLAARLPFQLTGAQRRVLAEVYADMAKPHPMHRLVQGDVGSGKTIVALFAALVALENGWQAAFMAPTELLAEQHFGTLRGFAQQLGVEAALLTGELTRAQRRELHARLASGEVPLVVGTHALIQEGVAFKGLGCAVIDEQHRFGVLQRAALRRMGAHGLAPDILLMSATPIPRTLAMAVYGDLEISVLDELPPGRQPVRTLLRHEGERAKVYDLVKRELDNGRQAYVVYPLVESSDLMELRDATTMAQELARAVFHDYRVGLVHGKMKGTEKDAVMRRFKGGDIQLLVSTTVIEVGIDVPNATIMVVEHAERFGLAQLHQLRGRVGRGGDASLCILLTPFHRGDDVHRRLQAMASTNDGFKIAEVDLELRGPGEMLGTRQSGLPDFRVANLIRDRTILDEARQAADEWLRHDPKLDSAESRPLRTVLAHRWAGRLELAEIG
ncbi:MAG TPA: ATP-dependent DNA helicase RecG [Candidatus Margulisiibacteriota bacterium]|nr:ATP-dependent DNA helicase RecG [Candidatus Margulisiibacteriota bacterium]